MSGTILVDFDGTLAEYYGWRDSRNGKPVPAMLARVLQWLQEGRAVKIFTARVCSAAGAEEIATQTKEVQDWCEQNGLPRLPVTAEKDFAAVEIWDDRAIQVKINTGRRMDGGL